MYPATWQPNPAADQGILAALSTALNDAMAKQGAKATSSTPSSPYMHGPNGLWSYPGLERPVISTRVIPTGLAARLPARASNVQNPLYPYLTGFTNPAQTQPNGVCDDAPEPGTMKNCFQTATWGRYSYQTRVIDLTRLGQIINRSEFTDFVIWNDPLGSQGSNAITNPAAGPSSLNLNNEVSSRFAEVAVMFQNKLGKQIWEGNPANSTAGGGYAEFPGLELLIRTGIKDAVTGQTCPSLDSLTVNYNYRNVSNTTQNPTDNNIVNVVTYTYRMLKNLAQRTGLNPVKWIIAMREPLFYELTAQWPCNYLTYRCITLNGVANMDVGDAIAMRDAMRQGRYLVIDGEQVEVVIDDAMVEETNTTSNRVNNTCFASDIKFLPLTVQGNKAVLFWEYFDWRGPGAALSAEVTGSSPLMTNYYWTDGGQYIWHLKPPANWCLQWIGLVKPRMVLLTPHLAATINNVQYCPLMHPRDSYPNDPYFVDGGATSRNTAPSLFPSW